MASFGKLTNSFLQASQETTLAFANLNFDFSIIKHEAPEEYRGLGEALSSRRKKAAEDGSVHITARKLSALFASDLPKVPHLVKAYGARASEIAKLQTVNPKGTAKHGIFAEYVGADGTSIWAAATSSHEAITIHLLACMLARIWKREEAVPIWVELVEQRKSHLQTTIASADSIFQFADLTASRIDIDRAQLDDWDASARAWLQTADDAKMLEQTQLRLLVDNISLPVSGRTPIYSAILNAWKKAMEVLDSLVGGTPQHINSGAVLLGLSAWHLYPDICLADNGEYVKQKDPLIAGGGVITLGLRNRGNDVDRGIYWSLPLSQSRYYGEPEVVVRHSGIQETRVPFEDFSFVMLGSVLGTWKLPDRHQSVCVDITRHLYEPMDSMTVKAGLEKDHQCFKALAEAATLFQRSEGLQRQQMAKLISFGRRRHTNAPDHIWPAPTFGVCSLRLLMQAVQTVQQRLKILRSWASENFPAKVLADATIRYREHERSHQYRYATVKALARYDVDLDFSYPSATYEAPSWLGDMHFYWTDGEARSSLDGIDIRSLRDSGLGGGRESQSFQLIPPGPRSTPEEHVFAGGHPLYAAVYIKNRGHDISSVSRQNSVDPNRLLEYLKSGQLSKSEITTISALCLPGQRHYDAFFGSLMAFGVADRIYRQVPGAKVDLQVTQQAFNEASWWKSIMPSPSLSVSFLSILSCLAFFETGGSVDIDPRLIESGAFAMCYGNSIFVSDAMLNDPLRATRQPSPGDMGIRRIIGNVGKPGLAFLTSPPAVRTKKVDFASWRVIAHEPFDGTSADTGFAHTSFHLSFTGFEMPLDLHRRGRRDVAAYLLETAISVYDRGDWVADIDIVAATHEWKTIESESKASRRPKRSSSHICLHGKRASGEYAPTDSLIAIDNWLELLDAPQQHGIVRAQDPMARLATAAFAVRLGKVMVLPATGICWNCDVEKLWERIDEMIADDDDDELAIDDDNEGDAFLAQRTRAAEVDGASAMRRASSTRVILIY